MDAKISNESRVIPFLKWAGGKRWLTYRIAGITPKGRYFEPFLGSAAMFFHSAPSSAVLSDCNRDLIGTYQALQADHMEVFKHLAEHAKRHSKEYYYELRDRSCRNQFTRAAKFIYLNRTCWNGLYRVNKQGSFNVPKGTKDSVLLDDDAFELVAARLQNAELACADFEDQINKAEAGDFIFADPPYTVRHQYNGFVKYNETLFSWDDQVRLRDALRRAKQRGAEILLTNADHESIRSIYADGFEISEAQRYSAISGIKKSRGTYAELLIR